MRAIDPLFHLVLASAWLAACGDPQPGQPPSDAATPDTAAAASNDAGSGSEAGPRGMDGGGACSALSAEAGVCNAMMDAGAVIAATCGTSVPLMTGGVIADGTYKLTSETQYSCPDGGLSGSSQFDSATMILAGGCLQGSELISVSSGGMQSQRVLTETGTLTVQGNHIDIVAHCSSLVGGFNSVNATFTATANTLSILYPYFHPELKVFTRM